MDPEDVVACGMIEATWTSSRWTTQRETPKSYQERKYFSSRITGSMESNLNLEGIELPKLSADSLSLKSGAPTHKSNFS